MKLTQELERDWEYTRQAFLAYRDLPPHKRYRALAKLFEKICPWIERGIQAAVMKHFILVQTETIVGSLYGHTTQRDALPRSHLLYQHWVESHVGRIAAKGVVACSVTNQTPGEPSAEFCDRFNKLGMHHRMMMYMYMVERETVTNISESTDIPYPEILNAVPRIWSALGEAACSRAIPSGWKIPRIDESGKLLNQ